MAEQIKQAVKDILMELIEDGIHMGMSFEEVMTIIENEGLTELAKGIYDEKSEKAC